MLTHGGLAPAEPLALADDGAGDTVVSWDIVASWDTSGGQAGDAIAVVIASGTAGRRRPGAGA